MKGKDIILCDFLSRETHDNSNPHETIPKSFNMHNVLHENYYNLGEIENYLVQMHSQTKSSGVELPEVHDVRKNLDPHIPPEKKTHANPINGKRISTEKPRIGQGRHVDSPLFSMMTSLGASVS